MLPKAMHYGGGRSSVGGAGSRAHHHRRSTFTARNVLLITAFTFATFVFLSTTIVEHMHMALSYSAQRPLPNGVVADAAIVLGYALTKEGNATGPLKGRVQVGLESYLQGRVSHIVFSGAHPDHIVPNSEAGAMRLYAIQLLRQSNPDAVIPGDDKWVLEEKSTSTRENALFSMRICLKKGWRSFLVVTNPFHQYRAAKVFDQVLAELGSEAEGVSVYIAEAPFAPHGGLLVRWKDWLDAWRELGAIKYYRARGFIPKEP